MIQDDIYTLLSGDAAIAAITTDIYPIVAPQAASYPAIVYQRTSSVRGQNFDEVENLVNSTFQIDSYSNTFTASVDLAEAVKAALNNYSGGTIQLIKLDFELDLLEASTDLFRVSQRFTIWHTE